MARKKREEAERNSKRVTGQGTYSKPGSQRGVLRSERPGPYPVPQGTLTSTGETKCSFPGCGALTSEVGVHQRNSP